VVCCVDLYSFSRNDAVLRCSRVPGGALHSSWVEEIAHIAQTLMSRLSLRLPRVGMGCRLAAFGIADLGSTAAAGERLSVVIIDPDNGKVILSQLPDTPRSPASTIKTVTTFASLDILAHLHLAHTRLDSRTLTAACSTAT